MQTTYIRWTIPTFFPLVLFLILVNISQAVIVFRASPTGRSDIYIMNDDGGNVRQLTDTPISEYRPRWSPDGKYITFERNLGQIAEKPNAQQYDIFIMDSDGSNERRLTDHPVNDGFHTWSPDGQQLAFSSSRNGWPEIYILELASGAIRQLTNNGENDAFSSMPGWSPDGQHIVHEQVITGGGRHIYITDIDGKETRPFLKGRQLHLIGDTVISKHAPRWSPDGKHVMYFEDHKRYEPERVVRLANYLVVVDREGGNPKKLNIPKSWWLHSACWAADGAEILFSADLTGWDTPPKLRNYDIYRYQLSTGRRTQVTDTPHREFDPDWVPGVLSVSPVGKSTVEWGKIKANRF